MREYVAEQRLVHADATQKNVLVQTLVVLMEEDFRLVHRREPQRGDAELTKEAAVRRSWEHLGLNRDSDFLHSRSHVRSIQLQQHYN